MQAAEGIVADRTQRDDLLARLNRKRVVDLHGCDFGMAWQIPGSPVVRPGGVVRLLAFGFRHK